MNLFTTMETPIGPLLLLSDGESLTGVYMEEHARGAQPADDWVEDAACVALEMARAQLGEYFAGDRRAFTVPLAPAGSPFQQAVWNLLREIPYGQTRSYGELARRLGRPGASRAVGSASARNPLSIIVPCHRVVGAKGALTGFAGGLERKEKLLEFERSGQARPAIV
jgi:methylated-DNA-[protein]-cysteine S-methyltransferase